MVREVALPCRASRRTRTLFSLGDGQGSWRGNGTPSDAHGACGGACTGTKKSPARVSRGSQMFRVQHATDGSGISPVSEKDVVASSAGTLGGSLREALYGSAARAFGSAGEPNTCQSPRRIATPTTCPIISASWGCRSTRTGTGESGCGCSTIVSRRT